MKNIVIILLLSYIALQSCSPVRTRYSFPKTPNNQTYNNNEKSVNSQSDAGQNQNGSTDGKYSSKNQKPKLEKDLSNTDKRFTDTTLISIETNLTGPKPNFESQIDESMKEFDNENYQSSCEKFKSLSETLAPDDSLRFVALFYHCECLIVKNILDEAEIKLKLMLSDKLCPTVLKEKIILRLGHINCAKGNQDEAEQYFKRLRAEYPKSEYISIANCDAVK